MKILIVGSLNGHIGIAAGIAQREEAQIRQAADLQAALQVIRNGEDISLILMDVDLPIRSLVERLRSERIMLPVVACGTQLDRKTAVQAVKDGALDYIPLPPDVNFVAALLKMVSNSAPGLIHADPAMSAVLQTADQVAPTNATILITGESGTGKEMLAQHIHRGSRRADKPFISVNCAAIPEHLIESELFGHEKGAFTGAISRRIGKFEAAHTGTLLLDEIGEMNLGLQAKLLRAIQEREIDRVGGAAPVKIDIRLIATTNRDLQREVREGRFREDLYYRLNIVGIRIPALRQRRADIMPLARHFARKYAEINAIGNRAFSAEAAETLSNHDWPGNVRELENVVHRAVLLCQDAEFGADDISLETTTPKPPSIGSLIGTPIADVERDLILGTLRHTLGNRTHAATLLGISIRTLRNKLRQYSVEGADITPPRHDRFPV